MNTPFIDSSQSSFRRVRWLLITAAILLPILLIATAAWVIWFGPQRKIDAEIARIRAAGEPVTPDELDAFYAYPPGDEDVTNLWLDAIAPLDSKEYEAAAAKLPFLGLSGAPPLPGEPWPDLEAAETFLQQQAETLKLLHEAAERGGAARYPLNFRAGINIVLSHAQRIRAAGRHLRLEARVRAHRGDAAGAARSILALAATGRALEHEPVMVSQLVSMAVHNMAFDEVRLQLPIVFFSDADLGRFHAVLRAADFQQALYRAMIGERVFGVHTFNNPTALGATPGNAASWVFVRTWYRGNFSFYLESMSLIISASKQPWSEALDEVQRVDAEVRAARGFRYVLTSLLTPALDSAFRAAARATAWARSADAAIAVELFRRRRDRLPDNLCELVPEFLPQVPEDPFSGGPLKFKVEPDCYVVYSVGPDKIDDGGKDEKRQRGPDYVFRVALPKSN